MKTEYVVGFAFWSRGSRWAVNLIQKQRPDWQKGKWNGIGGHVEDEETPAKAMVREYREETGDFVLSWEKFLQIETEYSVIHFFRSFEVTTNARTVTDECVRWFFPEALPKTAIPNLKWIIPLALSGERGTFFYGPDKV